jgi:hypothetical protein
MAPDYAGLGPEELLHELVGGREGLTSDALFELAIVTGARPRRRDQLGGLGDFRDARQLVLLEVARRDARRASPAQRDPQ